MKKLAIFINNLDGGGAERVTSILLSELKDSFEIHLILLENKIVYPVPTEIQVHTLLTSKQIAGGLLKIVLLPLYAFKYKNLCNELQIELSFSLLDMPNWTCCLLKRMGWRTPVAISQRNYVSDYIKNFGPLTRGVYKMLVKTLFPSADLVIPNAKAMAKDLVDNYYLDEHKICTIYNPLDVALIAEKIQQGELIELGKGKVHLLNIARLNERKNQTIILKALNILSNDKVNIHFLGKGEDEEKLQEISIELGLNAQSVFHGFKSNPISYLKSADIFVLSSNNEGFPNVILEALACQKIVISTNCNSGPLELLSPDNEDPVFTKEGYAVCTNGILVEVDNPAALSAAIGYVVQNLSLLKEKIESPSTLNFINQFSKEKIAKGFNNELSKLTIELP